MLLKPSSEDDSPEKDFPNTSTTFNQILPDNRNQVTLLDGLQLFLDFLVDLRDGLLDDCLVRLVVCIGTQILVVYTMSIIHEIPYCMILLTKVTP